MGRVSTDHPHCASLWTKIIIQPEIFIQLYRANPFPRINGLKRKFMFRANKNNNVDAKFGPFLSRKQLFIWTIPVLFFLYFVSSKSWCQIWGIDVKNKVSLGQVVLGGDSCSGGYEFEAQDTRRIIYHNYLWYWCLKRLTMNEKEFKTSKIKT